MSLLKPSFDGIGTGAGVAWPFFGILSSTLGLAAGGTFALITGSVAGLLFCAVTGIIFYISQQNQKNEEQAAFEKIELRREKLNTLIYLYLQTLYQQCQFDLNQPTTKINPQEIIPLMQKMIAKDRLSCGDEKLLTELLNALLTPEFENVLFQDFIRAYSTRTHETMVWEVMSAINNITNNLFSFELTNKKPPTLKMVQAAFIAVVGTFGAIAGCTAGFVGLLTGLGVITGFAAIPIVGWGTFLVALTFAAIVAANSVEQLVKHHQLQAEATMAKQLHHSLYRYHLPKIIEIKAKMMKGSDYVADFNPRQGFPFFDLPRMDEPGRTLTLVSIADSNRVTRYTALN